MQKEQGGCRSGRVGAGAAGSAVSLRAAHPTPPPFSVGAEITSQPICIPVPPASLIPVPPCSCPHGHMGMSGTGHPLRLTPSEGPLHPPWVSVGLLPAATPIQPPNHSGPSEQTHRPL